MRIFSKEDAMNNPREDQATAMLFTILDTKAGTYSLPAPSKNFGTVIRELTELLKQSNQYSAHPEDFQLFSIGGFDEDSGQIESWPPRHVVNFNQVTPETIIDPTPTTSIMGGE